MADEPTPTPPPAPPAPPADPPKPDPEGLGDAGKRAIEQERERAKDEERKRKAAEKTAKELQERLEKLELAGKSEAEKAVAQARREGEDAVRTELTAELVKAKVEVLAAGKLSHPEDAPSLLGDLGRFTAGGKPDADAITKALDELLEKRPQYAAGGNSPPPKPPGDWDGGATPPNPASPDQQVKDRLAKLNQAGYR